MNEDFTLYAVPENDAGVIAISADLNTDMLRNAYWNGFFPWPCEEENVLWSFPDPRGILPVADLHIPHGVKRELKKYHRTFELRIDTVFDDVIRACAAAERPGQDGTWITRKLVAAYGQFHREGFVHSFEAWQEGRLCGGLYGVSLGRIFCGESMFFHVSGASKFAFLGMMDVLQRCGVELIDTQMVTPMTESFGAVEIPAEDYLTRLAALRGEPLTTEALRSAQAAGPFAAPPDTEPSH